MIFLLYLICRAVWRTLRFLTITGIRLLILFVAFLVAAACFTGMLAAAGHRHIRNHYSQQQSPGTVE